MEEWFAKVECKASPTEEQLHIMALHFARVASVADGRLVLEMHLSALSLRQAVNDCLDRAQVILQTAGVPGAPIAAQVTTEAEYTRQLTAERDIDIVGVAEIQEILKIRHRQQVGQLAADHPLFPRVVKDLACGRIWLRSDIEKFDKVWRRRAGGRPS